MLMFEDEDVIRDLRPDLFGPVRSYVGDLDRLLSPAMRSLVFEGIEDPEIQEQLDAETWESFDQEKAFYARDGL